MKVKSESEVAQSCPTPSDPMDCSLPGSFVHGILQARVLEWDAIAFSTNCHDFCLILGPRTSVQNDVHNNSKNNPDSNILNTIISLLYGLNFNFDIHSRKF